MLVVAALLPLFVQVALTFVLMFAMARVRIGALTRREVKVGDVALGQPNWPEGPTKVANCFRNQFELPVLYYVLTALALFTRQADLLFVILAWLFVLSRLAHAFIHTGSNAITYRFQAYSVGAIILLIMWIIFAVRILVASM
jgi:hypothetical protein